MNPYLSVRGGSVPLNLVAVRSFVLPILGDWKNDPRFCRESSTVGGRLSSGTIDASSTDGSGASSVGVADDDPDCRSPVGGDTAVVGKGREDEILLNREGRAGSSPVLVMALVPLSVALETDDSKLRPTAKAWSPYPLPSRDGVWGAGDTCCSALVVDDARLREVRRPGGSRMVIPSSRALLTSECAR